MNDQIKNVCKIGQGSDCCRYLMMGPKGFECAKHTELKTLLDKRVMLKTITAQGDNCEGKTIEELNNKIKTN
jgi:hypothetical protein